MKRYPHVFAALFVLAVISWTTAGAGTVNLREVPDRPGGPDVSKSSWLELEDRLRANQPVIDEGPSMKRAIAYSLLLPGLGEHFSGHTYRARMFFAVEAAVWTSFIVFRAQGHLREENYKEFAQQFAGVNGTGHSDDFYMTLGLHDSSGDYEAEFKAEGRLEIWPEVGYYDLEKYYLEKRISDFEEWAWSSSDRRIDFREMRSSSRLAYRRSWYMVAAAAANRVVSAVSVYQVFKSGRTARAEQTSRYLLDFGPPSHDARGEYTAAVTLIRTF